MSRIYIREHGYTPLLETRVVSSPLAPKSEQSYHKPLLEALSPLATHPCQYFPWLYDL